MCLELMLESLGGRFMKLAGRRRTWLQVLTHGRNSLGPPHGLRDFESLPDLRERVGISPVGS